MAYIKYKELTKYFDFSKYLENSDLPEYILDYIYEDEFVLCSYKTFRDHGIFTNEKIVLFDNAISFGSFKQIYTIPYKKISSFSIVYRPSKVELRFDLESGYQLRLRFVNTKPIDKVRLKLLYSVISRAVSNQKPSSKVMKDLIDNNITIKGGKNGKE